MAGLADDPSPALLRIKRPMVGGQTACIDIDREAAGSGLRRKRRTQVDSERGEAAIEADSEVSR